MNIPDEHAEIILQALQFYEHRMKPGAEAGWPGAMSALNNAKRACHAVRQAANSYPTGREV